MKIFRSLWVVILTAVAILPPQNSVVAETTLDTIETYTGTSICSPGAVDYSNCLVMGPAKIQQEWASKGVNFPLSGLPAYTPDESYNTLPYYYAKINADPKREIRLFSSLDDAIKAENQTGSIPAGETRWVAYITRADIDSAHYVQIPDSFEWVRASPASISFFQGLAFFRTPDHEFGWLADNTASHVAPSLESAQTGKQYYRSDVVEIFGKGRGNEADWYQIGLNEWVLSRFVKKVTINTTPPEGVTNNRWIEVNLYEQTLAVYENNQLVFATMIATGLDPFFTKPGLFQIQRKLDTERMTGAFEADRSDYYYLDKVPWTMYFDGARALHAAYWRTMFGFPQSHGCVNLSPGDAHFLFDWANEGDWVYVWDPSGQTPTDPSKYGEGGA